MATEQPGDPIEAEAVQVLADHPGLLEELRDADEDINNGTLDTVSDEEIRRRLAAKGISLSPRPPDAHD